MHRLLRIFGASSMDEFGSLVHGSVFTEQCTFFGRCHIQTNSQQKWNLHIILKTIFNFTTKNNQNSTMELGAIMH